jgi:hypothetical protein
MYDPTRNCVVSAHNIPTFTLKRNGKTKGAIDVAGIVALVRSLAPTAKYAFLELVGPFKKQGTSSVWSFSRCDTALETSVVAAAIPYERVPPGVWKKALGAPADKDGARVRANQLMPESAQLWREQRGVLTKENAIGIAEAALIAYYGAQKQGLTTRCAQT